MTFSFYFISMFVEINLCYIHKYLYKTLPINELFIPIRTLQSLVSTNLPSNYNRRKIFTPLAITNTEHKQA